MTLGRNFHKSCGKNGGGGGQVGENPGSAARRRIFALLDKPEGGGGAFKRPPPAGCGLMAFNAILVVPNTKTTKYSSETSLSTVLVQAILLEHNARPAGAAELTGSESLIRAASALAICSWLGLPAVGGSGHAKGKLTSVERGRAVSGYVGTLNFRL